MISHLDGKVHNGAPLIALYYADTRTRLIGEYVNIHGKSNDTYIYIAIYWHWFAEQ